MHADDAELLDFKRQIDLPAFLGCHGYELERSKSSANSKTFTGGRLGEVITRHTGEAWVFFTRSKVASGSVIEFVQAEFGMNLGHARKYLRSYVPGAWKAPDLTQAAAKHAVQVAKPLAPEELQAQAQALVPYSGPGYLERERGITAETITAFAAHIRQDNSRFHNVCFPHTDANGLTTGWEVRNHGFKAFLADGQKSLWVADLGGKTAVITESAIDGMSYRQAHDALPACYISIAGAMNPTQREDLEDFLKSSDAFDEVIVATDNDADGRKYFEVINAWRPDAVWRPAPVGGDWNEAICAAGRLPMTEAEALEIGCPF